jgi:outer membrane protease
VRDKGYVGDNSNVGRDSDRVQADKQNKNRNICPIEHRNITFINVKIIIIFLCLASNAYTQWKLTVNFGGGFLHGTAYELVYLDEINDTLLSELQWKLQPLWYMQSSFHGEYKKFFADISFKWGFPGKTGTMEDRDWQDRNNPYSLTNFSSHTNDTNTVLLCDIYTGYLFSLRKRNLSFSIYGTFSYWYFSWQAQDGYTQYANSDQQGNYQPWTSDIPKSPLYGTGISYSQTWQSLGSGVALTVPIAPTVQITGGSFISFVFSAVGEDTHFFTQAQYRDTINKGLVVEPYGILTWLLHDKYSFDIRCAYRVYAQTRGKAEARTTGSQSSGAYSSFGSVGGASLGVWDISLTAHIKLF